ncbi:hypothetical protein FQN53_001443 [Emmonsiellopsis sp. PD_33]|nr:hypothetical protein FQN53_001443 [Emmonsiellopsis sp. PD_33]
MVRLWTSILFLSLVLAASVAAVDLDRANRRQARADNPIVGVFKSFSSKFRARDAYVDRNAEDFRRYDLVRRQGIEGGNNSVSETPMVSPTSATLDPNTSKTDTASPTDGPGSSTTESPTKPTSTTSPTETPTKTPPTSTPTSSPTKTQTPTETSKPSSSSTEKTTSPEPTPTKSSTVLIPTTDSEGALSTITSVVIVHPTPTEEPTDTPNGPPGLQTGGAAATIGFKKEMLAVLGGAVAVAMAL